MSQGSCTKMPCAIFWDIGDCSALGPSIKETIYLVQSVCISRALDVRSIQCVSSINSISEYVGDSDSVKLITLSDYSKSVACAKIVQLIEQFLYEHEPGSSIIIIDPDHLFSSPVIKLSEEFPFETFFIHLKRDFDSSLDLIANHHFYLSGNSIYPARSLFPTEIGTIEVGNCPQPVTSSNFVLEIDTIFKPYGRIEGATIANSDKQVIWIFFPSQTLAQDAASVTRNYKVKEVPLSVAYRRNLPCSLESHPILGELVSKMNDRHSSPLIDLPESSTQQSASTIKPQSVTQSDHDSETNKRADSTSHLETAKTPDVQTNGEATLTTKETEPKDEPISEASIVPIATNGSTASNPTPSSSQIDGLAKPLAISTSNESSPALSEVPIPISFQPSSNSSQSHVNFPQPSTSEQPEQCSSSNESAGHSNFAFIEIRGKPDLVTEIKFCRDMHGIFKKYNRCESLTLIDNGAVIIGFITDEAAKHAATSRDGMIYYGKSLKISHIENPSKKTIAYYICKAVKSRNTILKDPALVPVKSRKRSASHNEKRIESVKDIGVISFPNIPDQKGLRNLLNSINGLLKSQSAISDSAIWFRNSIWVCFPDKNLAKAAVKGGTLMLGESKLVVNYIETPPQALIKNHFVNFVSTQASHRQKAAQTKRAKHENEHQSSPKQTSSPINSPSSFGAAPNTKKTKPKKNAMSQSHTPGEATTSGQNLKTSDPEVAASVDPAKSISQEVSKSLNSGANGTREEQNSAEADSQTNQASRKIDDVEVESAIHISSRSSDGEANREAPIMDQSGSSHDSLHATMFSESIITPINGFTTDSRYDYYQSGAYGAHKFSTIVGDALVPENFLTFNNVDFKLYPNKFWVLFQLLRLTWPFGVLKIAHIQNNIFILFASQEGALMASRLFNKNETANDQNDDNSVPRLQKLKAAILETVPPSVLTLVAMYSSTYSPWCFTDNWNLFFLAIQVQDFVEAHDFAKSKAIVSNFGSLFIKPKDSSMIVAFSDEKRILHTMMFMKQYQSRFDFCPNPGRPHDLYTTVRDYDLTGRCARLSQIAIMQTFKLIQFKMPPPFVITKFYNKRTQYRVGQSSVQINFNATSARSCETSPPVRNRHIELTNNDASPTPVARLEARVNYYLKIEYNARHKWCYMYDLLSKLWYYRIVKIIYKQDHPSQQAETWIEVPNYINRNDIITRLQAINYLQLQIVETVIRPSFDILSCSISTGSSPWVFNEALSLHFATVIRKSQFSDQIGGKLETEIIKHIVEDEHAVFVKLFADSIWIAFPDSHSLIQGLLLLNYEQRIRTDLMAYAAHAVPDDLLTSIDIEDLVGVNKDLALANSLKD